jgi:hypothetical protein
VERSDTPGNDIIKATHLGCEDTWNSCAPSLSSLISGILLYGALACAAIFFFLLAAIEIARFPVPSIRIFLLVLNVSAGYERRQAHVSWDHLA